ncbi:sensory rhodopsin transducer [Streptomyces sp. NPDC047028]|uniref:sensory rhodopsin transducer n=1 Tax=Streptomyces sp. NPDC047028 TaxID=3155793 RepID=UPI0033D5EC6E
MEHIGHSVWTIPEGFIFLSSTGPKSMISLETACILSTCDEDAHVRITMFFPGRERSGPHHVTVPARRTRNQVLQELADADSVPVGSDGVSVVVSEIPVVVQHTRLGSRHPADALLSTRAVD